MLNDIAFINLTNDGYIEYTENCLKSLEKNQIIFTLLLYWQKKL